MADILLREEDLKFASTMVHTLNTILLTSTELFQLRNQLKDLRTPVPTPRAPAPRPPRTPGPRPLEIGGEETGLPPEASLVQCRVQVPRGGCVESASHGSESPLGSLEPPAMESLPTASSRPSSRGQVPALTPHPWHCPRTEWAGL